MYHNEREVGSTILAYLKENPELKREDIHYTSKLASNERSYDAVRKSITKSVKECGLGYIDLFLLHSPYGGKEARLTSWKALEDAVLEGEVRIPGVSNYGEKHVSRSPIQRECSGETRRKGKENNEEERRKAANIIPMLQSSSIAQSSNIRLSQIDELLACNPRLLPAINQIEVHPFNTRTALTSHCNAKNIVIESYAPLARAYKMKHPTVVALSKKYDCTPAQLLLRWNLQHGNVVLPKSVKRERIIENADVGGFEIAQEDVGVLDELDEYLVTGEFPVYFRCCVIHCCSLVFLGGHARALLTFVLATDWDPVDAE
jgi:diketogulonate reductase-like aldo/keto reductase